MVAVRADPEKVYPRYLFAALRSQSVQDRISSMHVGTLIPHFKKGDFANLQIPVPNDRLQRFIGDVYFNLSAKIEFNGHAASLLSDLVSASFTALSGSCKEYEPVSTLATFHKGVSYRSADLQRSTTAMVTLKSFDRNGGYKQTGLKPFVGKHKPKQEIVPGELVVAQTDLTQAAEVVGRVVRVPSHYGVEMLVASLDLVIVGPKSDVPQEFLYAVLLDDEFRQHCRSRTSGTTVLHLASDALPSYRAPKVSRENQQRYAGAMRPLLRRRDQLGAETDRLVALRDSILAELLSGRLSVPEAHETMEAAS